MIYNINKTIMEAHRKMTLTENFKYGSISLGPGYKEDDYADILDNYHIIKVSKHELVKVSNLNVGDVIFVTVTNTSNDDTVAAKGRIDSIDSNELGEYIININEINFKLDSNEKVFVTTLKKK